MASVSVSRRSPRPVFDGQPLPFNRRLRPGAVPAGVCTVCKQGCAVECAVARALDRKYLRRENFLLKHELSEGGQAARGRLLGNSPAISAIREMLAKVAPTPTSVLFTGASGTGKEIAARTLHGMSERAGNPFVAVNCAAISPDHLAEELFGIVESDERTKDGLFLHADGGTLFLDEVAQMPEQVQAALLRVLDALE